MADPFAEMVTLLQPTAPLSKLVSGAGAWRVERSELGRPFYCAILEGAARLTIEGQAPIELRASDFVLIPAVYRFAMSGLDPATSNGINPLTVTQMPGEVRHGNPDGPPDVRLLVGHFAFGSSDAALLISLLPQFIHVSGERRFATIVELVREEARASRPARDMILGRLMEVLLVEALRSTVGTKTSPGLLRGLADSRLAAAIRRMHEDPTRDWTVEQLAQEAALSRSAFFERFSRAVGLAPMAYLLNWRMALAKNMLQRNEAGIAEIARRVGYGSASAFSVAFARHVGLPPARYARQQPVPAS